VTGETAGSTDADRDIADLLIEDGHGLIAVSALGLLASGLFAWFLAVTGQFLPHDMAWLETSEQALRALADGRVAQFMAHDRAAFGGTLIAIAILYLWLVRVPLRQGEAWAWWVLSTSGAIGFASFLTFLGTGYVDTWHGTATLGILVPFMIGLVAARRTLKAASPGIRLIRRTEAWPHRWTRPWLGQWLLVVTAGGMVVAGAIIATVGSLVVFVPQDLEYIGLDRAALDAVDPRLVPLIAHDRAGFGGGLLTVGVVLGGCVWCTPLSRSLWQAMLLAGITGFGAAVGTHFHVGYIDVTHVGPAVAAAIVFGTGLILTR